MLCWPLYPETLAARLLCASVPLLAALHFAAVALGWVEDPSLVASHTVRPLTGLLDWRIAL